jgi:hypothetical protein
MDWRKPTITELIPPSGMSVQEMNGGPDPNIPKVQDIQSHLLEEYAEEARRRALEEDVYRRELELEMMREKERIVSGLDNGDWNALLRTFDKVSVFSCMGGGSNQAEARLKTECCDADG